MSNASFCPLCNEMMPPDEYYEDPDFTFMHNCLEPDDCAPLTPEQLIAGLENLGFIHENGSPRPDYAELWLENLPAQDSSFVVYMNIEDGKPEIGIDGPLIKETAPAMGLILASLG